MKKYEKRALKKSKPKHNDQPTPQKQLQQQQPAPPVFVTSEERRKQQQSAPPVNALPPQNRNCYASALPLQNPSFTPQYPSYPPQYQWGYPPPNYGYPSPNPAQWGWQQNGYSLGHVYPTVSYPQGQHLPHFHQPVMTHPPTRQQHELKCTKMTSPVPSRCHDTDVDLPAFSHLANFPLARQHNNCVMCNTSEFKIPKCNKGICNSCDSTIWVVNASGLHIKWCKGCKNFQNLVDFGEKVCFCITSLLLRMNVVVCFNASKCLDLLSLLIRVEPLSANVVA